MSELIEMEFDKEEELLDAVGATEKPLMVGDGFIYYKDTNKVVKLVTLSCFEFAEGQPLILSWKLNVGVGDAGNDKNQQELQQKSDQAKQAITRELKNKGYAVYQGAMKKFDTK